MPTLDVRGVNVNPLLTINYHSSRVPNSVQLRRLNEVVLLAREFSQRAERTLRRANTPPYDPEPIVRRILESHFRFPSITNGSTINWRDNLDYIVPKFRLISMGLSARITISDAYSIYLSVGRQIKGYTITKRGHVSGVANPQFYGSIHMDFEVLKHERDKLMMVTMLIHEAAHKFCSMSDKRYRNAPGYSKLSFSDLKMNPDSYAFTALSIYKNQCITEIWGRPSGRKA